MTTTIAVVNLKGGTGKTTSAAYLAHAFRDLSRTVLLVDADPQGSTARWAHQSAWPIPTIELPAPDLHRQLPGIAGARYDVVLIDCPPYPKHTRGSRPTEQAGIVESAIRAADSVLIPLAPTMMELERVPEVIHAIEAAAAKRGRPQTVRVLLNRTQWNWRDSTRIIRENLIAQGCQVLTAEIPQRLALAQSFGAPITGTLHGYFSAAEELETAR